MRPTVIIPFHRNLDQLGTCLAAVRRALPSGEVIVAADGAQDDCSQLAAVHRAHVVIVPGPSGPAVARNRGAAVATGEILVFVDADVAVERDAVQRVCDVLERNPDVAGVFGAYTRTPPASNFMSQFKNLSHTYVHEVGNPEARTFWAGLGAVRSDAFRSVGGYDERFTRPSVEDIDLGYRLTLAGYRLRLDPSIRGTHLKRWTLWSCIMTDIRARGIPWTQLIHRFKALSNDLNTSIALRLSVLASYGFAGSILVAPFTAWAWPMAGVSVFALLTLNAAYYRWFVEQRGWAFGIGVVTVHILHHICNGISFVAGTLLHLANAFGLGLPGALPPGAWGLPLAADAGTRKKSG